MPGESYWVTILVYMASVVIDASIALEAYTFCSLTACKHLALLLSHGFGNVASQGHEEETCSICERQLIRLTFAASVRFSVKLSKGYVVLTDKQATGEFCNLKWKPAIYSNADKIWKSSSGLSC